MATPPSDAAPSIAALASVCAGQIKPGSSQFDTDSSFQSAFERLLTAVAGLDQRYAFDREGRPAALQAVRNALPAVETELFDVILEDVACELAATREALYQVLLAALRPD